MELKDTVELMTSADYRQRFEAEYYQLEIRIEKLSKLIRQYETGTLEFTPSCSLELLKYQRQAMHEYLHALKLRAEAERIEV